MANRKIALIPLSFSVFLMILIFSFSAQSGENSSDFSIKVTRIIAKLIFFNYSSMSGQIQDTIVHALHGFVRKAAHFSIYALLGLSVFFSSYFLIKSPKNQIVAALSICTAYACFDELHQLFRPGRGGSVTDVFIDACGAACGIMTGFAIISIAFYLNRNKTKK